MKKTWTIAWKDYRSYFNSPIAYIVMTAFLGIMGWMFFFNLFHFNLQNLQYKQFNMGKTASITDGIVRPLYGNMNVIFLFLVPFITMRLLAEERKNHTLELLLTAPITIWQLVLGKFLACTLFVSTMYLITLAYPLILIFGGSPDIGPIISSYIGTLLMSCCYIAIGLFFSSTTENQIVAGVLTFASGLFLWIIAWAGQSAGPVWGDVINYVSLINHYNNFSQGLLSSEDFVFYLSFIFFWLFLTHRTLDSYRWRT
jgi:ABC-2 type transport system permease protein